MNKIEINIPEGFEIDQSKSDLSKGVIEFKPVEKKKLSYGDVAIELFVKNGGFYTSSSGTISEFSKCIELTAPEPNNATSKEQLECLMAYNKLRNVAVYLNKGWKANWTDLNQSKYYIYFNNDEEKFIITPHWNVRTSNIYFSSEELAKEAISILGEEEIKKALFIY